MQKNNRIIKNFSSPKAFTLAEVLITLAIIGVVAALTIPTVVKNYQKSQTTAKLRKAYSIINQAFNNSQAENGMYQTWDTGVELGAIEYFNKYWKPYLKVAKICSSYSDCGYKSSTPWKFANGVDNATNVVVPAGRTTFLTPDGILFVLFSISSGAVDDSIVIDLNGSKEPNIAGKDVFAFTRTNKGILPNCYEGSAAYINSNCSKINSGSCCAARIMIQGWEIKDNYPW